MLLNIEYQEKGHEKGQKPAFFPANKAITQKAWNRSLRQKRELSNPVRTSFRFVKYLNENPNATYDDLSNGAGVTKARDCQMIALCKRLPTEITEFLMDTHEPEILKYFTERRLRPLTLLASDEEKIEKFDEMMEALCTRVRHRQLSLDFYMKIRHIVATC